ncbi:MAG TPA: hypothetical protein PLO37_17810 [Candidatus Hydrogenedentes bacterium]|nr:hypothetical protein [Candidatus Hydrogenedentota bacterium]HPG68706.1 hypothetical protein [Candidatus Hydrogenedentota bacterium]
MPSPSGAVPDEARIRVRIEGSAPGAGDAGRRDAIENAERAALAQIIEAAVGETNVAKVAALTDRLREYAHATRVLDHRQAESRTTVEVETFIDADQVRADAAALLLELRHWPPTALLLVAERVGNEAAYSTDPSGMAHTALLKAIEEGGITVEDSSVVRGYYDETALVARLRGDLDIAAPFARENLVDCVVLVESTANIEPVPAAANCYQAEATVHARVFRSSDGKLLESIVEKTRVHGPTAEDSSRQGIEDACAKLRMRVRTAIILGAAEPKAADTAVITLVAPGEQERYQAVLDRLEAFAGPDTVERLFCSPLEARFRVHYGGSIGPLVDCLTVVPYNGFHLDPRHVVERDIRLYVIAE